MHPNEAQQKMAKATMTTGRRPYRSDSGPTKSWNTAFIAKYRLTASAALA